MELSVEIIEQLVKIAVANKLDRLKVGDLEILKTKHDVPKTESKNLNNPASVNDADELLFWSTSSPSLTQEQIEALAVNELPKTKRGRKPKDNS
jgi:hypothetical protein